jgi:hypothetical protein
MLAWFIAGTLSLSLLALLETLISRWPGRDRLYYPIFDQLFMYTDNWGAALEALIVALVLSVPALRRQGSRVAATLGDHPRRTAALTFVLAALCARIAYHATPLAMDEYAQLAQATAFAQGKLSWVVPPDLLDRMIPPGFRGYFLAVNAESGRVASQYWPGFAALLGPFAWIGAPWLLNPALTAVALLLMHAICVRALRSRAAGGWAMLFALGSAEFTITGISFYSMPAHMVLNLLFAWLLLEPDPRRAFLAGLAGGLALVLHNPMPHLLFAAPWFIWLAWTRRAAPLAALIVGYLPIGMSVGIAWPLFAGSINAVAGSAPLPHHTALETLRGGYRTLTSIVALPSFLMVCARLYATWKIWIWSAPGLLLLTIGGCRVVRGPLLLLSASAALTWLFYWLVPFDQGHGWGERYFSTAWMALPILGAAFIVSQPAGTAAGDNWREWAGGLALGSLVLSTLLRLWQVDAIITEHVAQRIPAPAAGRWLVFIAPRAGLYSWDMVQNLPGDDHRLVLMSFGAGRDAVFAASRFPLAHRTLIDARGSLWSLPDDSPR